MRSYVGVPFVHGLHFCNPQDGKVSAVVLMREYVILSAAKDPLVSNVFCIYRYIATSLR